MTLDRLGVQEAEVGSARAEALLHSARIDRDLETLRELATTIETQLTIETGPVERGRLLYALGLTEQERYSNADVVAFFEEAIELLRDEDPANAASCAAGVAVYLLVLGQVNTAVDRAGDAFRLLNTSAASTDSVFARANLSTFFLHFGALDQSVELAGAAFDLARSVGDDDATILTGRMFCYNGLEVVRQFRSMPNQAGRRDRWLASCGNGANYLHEEGTTPYIREVVGNETLAAVAVESGEGHEALCRLRKADEARVRLAWPLEKESERERSRRLLLEAIALCTVERFGEASKAFAAASELVEKSTDWVLQMRYLEEHAVCLAASGDLKQAYEKLQRQTDSVRANLVVRNNQLARLLESRVDLELHARRLTSTVETDSLTGVRSRHFLNEYMGRQESETPVTVFLIDVDRFKEINDRFGHLVGDRVLARVAQVIADTCRIGDLVCRFGGEEFVIIPHEPGIDHEEFAQRLRRATEQTDFGDVGDQVGDINVTISVGYCSGPARDLKLLLERADMAMFEAKRLGRNRVVGWTAHLELASPTSVN